MADGRQFDQRGQKVIGTQINVAGGATLPPAPLVLVPHLPSPPRDFTGREEEISDLLAGFDRGATITGLRGMGGIGKTALAYALAEKLIDRYPDGQILVELRGSSEEPMTPAEAMARVMQIYHPEAKLPDEEAALANMYRSLLHNLRVLLLLDNAASREQVESLLPPSGCAAIITSRNRFALPGLKDMDLNVLPLDDARRLLLEIAERIGALAEDLARLCGCLPIALRNAAYVLKERGDLGVAEYLQRLQDARNRVELVEASFSLSYDQLSPELRRLWRLLSVFPSDFDRKGAAAVWELETDSAASSLSDLVKWSLVEFDPAGERYRLHDLARDYATSRLQPGENGESELRHAEHYMDALSASKELYKKGGDGVLDGLKLLDREWANIQAGQAWAYKNLETNSQAADLCMRYPDAGAYVLDLRLHPLQKISWLETGLAAARKLKDRGAEGVHLGNLGSAYYLLGDARQAIEYYEQALVIEHEIGDRRAEGAVLGNLGLAYAALGDARKAIEYYEQHLTIAREIGDRRNEGNTLGNLGIAYKNLGDARNAIDYYEQALAIAREIGDRRGEGNTLGNLGSAYYLLGDARQAIDYYEQQLKITQEIGDRRGEGNALWNMSLALYELDKHSEAIKNAECALQIYEQIESPLAATARQQLAEWRK